jgi:hypothetical protein
MKHPLKVCLFFLLALAPAIVMAQDSRFMTEVASDYTECAAFYGLGGACLEAGGRSLPTGWKKIQASIEDLAAQTSKRAGMSPAGISARLTLFLQGMKTEISDNCSNISVLILKYGATCKRRLDDPEFHANEVFKRIEGAR